MYLLNKFRYFWQFFLAFNLITIGLLAANLEAQDPIPAITITGNDLAEEENPDTKPDYTYCDYAFGQNYCFVWFDPNNLINRREYHFYEEEEVNLNLATIRIISEEQFTSNASIFTDLDTDTLPTKNWYPGGSIYELRDDWKQSLIEIDGEDYLANDYTSLFIASFRDNIPFANGLKLSRRIQNYNPAQRQHFDLVGTVDRTSNLFSKNYAIRGISESIGGLGKNIETHISVTFHPGFFLDEVENKTIIDVNSQWGKLQFGESTGALTNKTYEIQSDDSDFSFSFDSDSRLLTIDPSTPVGKYNLTYEVIANPREDKILKDKKSFTVTLIHPYELELADTEHVINTVNKTYSYDAGAAGGLPPLTYNYLITGQGDSLDVLPAGISYDNITGEFSGIPSEAGAWNLSYTVTDARGFEINQKFNLTVIQDYELQLYQPHDYGIRTNEDFSIQLESNAFKPGDAPVDITLKLLQNGAYVEIPNWMEFDESTLELSGTAPSTGVFELQFAGADNDDDTESYNFIVRSNPDSEPDFANNNIDITYAQAEQSLDFTAKLIDTTTSGDIPYSYEVFTTDAQDNLVDFPEWVSYQIVNNQILFSGAIPEFVNSSSDTYHLRIKATDYDGDSDTESIILQVFADTVPTPKSVMANITVDQDVSTNIDIIGAVQDIGNAPYTYSLFLTDGSGLPPYMTWSADNLSLNILSDKGYTDVELTQRITDKQGDTITVDFTLTVDSQIGIQALSSSTLNATENSNLIQQFQLVEGQLGNAPLDIEILLKDADEEFGALTAGMSFDEETLQFNYTGGLSGTQQTFQLTIVDVDNDTAQVEFDVLWHEDSVPQFLADRNVDEIQLLEQAEYGFSLDLATFNGSLQNTPYSYEVFLLDEGEEVELAGWLDYTLNTDNITFSGKVTAFDQEQSDYALRLRVTDADGDTAVEMVNVSVFEDTTPSFLTNLDSINVTQFVDLENVALPLVQEDANNGPYTYSLQVQDSAALPAGLSFLSGNKTLTGNPTGYGYYVLNYTVSDAQGDSVSQLVDLTIVITPTIPWFQTINDQTFIVGEQNIDITPSVSGGDGELVYSVSVLGIGDSFNSLPLGVSQNPSTGLLSGTALETGTWNITMIAVDEDLDASSTRFQLVVEDDYAIKLASLSTISIPVDRYISIAMQIDEDFPGNAPLTYALTQSNNSPAPAWLVIDEENLQLQGNSSSEAATYQLVFTATDANNDSHAIDITLNLIAENSKPIFHSSSNPDSFDFVGAQEYNFTLTLASVNGTESNAPYSYKYSWQTLGGVEVPLPAWLSFEQTDSEVSFSGITPVFGMSKSDTYTLKVQVSDVDGDEATELVDIRINQDTAPSFASNASLLQAAINLPLTSTVLPNVSSQPGNGPYSFKLADESRDDLPAGLSFDSETRTISGTPSEYGNFSLNYSVIDAQGDSAWQTVSLRLSKDATVPYIEVIAEQKSIIGHQTFELTPSVLGGNGQLSFSLAAQGINGSPNTIPAGLSLDASTGTISGSPTSSGSWDLTLSVLDAQSDTGTRAFRLVVEADVGLEFDTIADIIRSPEGKAISYPLSFVTNKPGNKPLTFSLKVSDGQGGYVEAESWMSIDESSLSFNAEAQLFGTETQMVQLTVTDVDGDEAIALFQYDVTVDSSPSFLYSQIASSYFVEQQTNNELELDLAHSDGYYRNDPYTYTILAYDDNDVEVALPSWLSYETTSQAVVIKGTPPSFQNNSQDIISLALRAQDVDGQSNQRKFELKIFEDTLPTISAGFSNQIATYLIPFSSAILPEALEDFGNAPYQYGLTTFNSTSLPSGLYFDEDQLILSGTPTAKGIFDLVFWATDKQGDRTELAFSINVQDNPKPIFSQAETSYIVERGVVTNITLPLLLQGGEVIDYTLSDIATLPSGITLSEGKLVGTIASSAPLGEYSFNWTATDLLNQSTFQSLILDVQPLKTPQGLSSFTDQSVYEGDDFVSINLTSLSQGNSGNGDLTYRFTTTTLDSQEVSDTLPAGLSFNSTTQMLSGKANTFGDFTVEVTVGDSDENTDASDEFKLSFSLEIVEAIKLISQPSTTPLHLALQTNYVLPSAVGGSAPYTYEVTQGIPPGLAFNSVARDVNGLPFLSGDYTITYQITDSENRVFTKDIDLVVEVKSSDFEFVLEDHELTLGQVVSIQLPTTVQESLLAYNYDLSGSSGLPHGLSFDKTTRRITGTASSFGSWELSYTASFQNSQEQATFYISVVADEQIAQDILGKHAMQYAHTTGQTVKERFKKQGQAEAIPYHESKDGLDKELNIPLGSYRLGIWQQGQALSSDRESGYTWSSDTAISQVGIDFSSTNSFGGIIMESAESEVTFESGAASGTYDLDVDYNTLFAGYRSSGISLWAAKSFGKGVWDTVQQVDSFNSTQQGSLDYSASMLGFVYSSSGNWNIGLDVMMNARLSAKGLSKTNGEESSSKFYIDYAPKQKSRGFTPRFALGYRSDESGQDSENSTTAGIDIDLGGSIHYSIIDLDFGLYTFAADGYDNSGTWFSLSISPKAFGLGLSLDHQQGLTSSQRGSLLESREMSFDQLNTAGLSSTGQLAGESTSSSELSYSFAFGKKQLALYLASSAQTDLSQAFDYDRFGMKLHHSDRLNLAVETTPASTNGWELKGAISFP